MEQRQENGTKVKRQIILRLGNKTVTARFGSETSAVRKREGKGNVRCAYDSAGSDFTSAGSDFTRRTDEWGNKRHTAK